MSSPAVRPLVLLVAAAWLSFGCTPAKVRADVDGACDSDRDCAYGLICRGAPVGQPGPRTCVYETFGSCSTPQDCLAGHVCRDGGCSVECVASSQCKAGRHCVVGECRLIDEERPCRNVSDCAADEECIASVCRPSLRMRCFKDLDCGGGERCVDGRCR